MPKLSEVGEHPNIEIFSPAQVEAVEGEVGNFRVTIRERSRFVTDECTRCNLCVEVCPQIAANEFDVGMTARKAIYTPMQQAVPSPYVIDLDLCLNDPPNYLPCGRCSEACLPKCIDFNMPRERVHTREVAAIINSVGFDLIDPGLLQHYGYGKHPDVLTSMEFERMLAPAGPTGGEIVKPSNGEHPKNILFVLCVGSRDRNFYRHCSRFCCMYSIKEAYQAIDHGVSDVTLLYMDVRAYGKGFDAFFDRTRNGGAKFVRGHPSAVEPNGSGLVVRYENTDSGRLEMAEADMVVLATAVRPTEGLGKLAEVLGIELGEDGFLKTVETKGGAITTTRPGIYTSGCAAGPKDIPDSVAEGSASAAIALTHIEHRQWPELEEGEPIENLEEPRIGVFVCHCGSNIAGVIDVVKCVEFAQTLPDVVYAQHQMFSCTAMAGQEIAQAIRDNKLTRAVVAACSPKTHEPFFRRVCLQAGLNPYLLEMVNLRNHDTWVHKNYPEQAFEKALDMIRMGVDRARLLEPLESSLQPMTQQALVIGGGVAGMTAAANLARQGYRTHLVEKGPELGGILRKLDVLAPANVRAADVLEEKVREVKRSGVKVHLNTEVEQIGGHIGSFYARLSDGKEVRAGAVILATGAVPYRPTEFDYGKDSRVVTNLELESLEDPAGEHVTFIGCVGSRRNGTGCSRYCCESMIAQALRLRRAGKKVRVLYKDIRTYSRNAEEAYEQAAREGVQFIQYAEDKAAEEAVRWVDGQAVVYDELTGRELRIPTDLLVLTVGLRPPEQKITEQLKVALDTEGFLLERHPKLAPAETPSPGIFLAGTAQYPKDVREALAQGLAAASKAGTLLTHSTVEKEPLTAHLIEDKCIVCGICVNACPFGAIELVGKVKEGTMRFIEAACQGCGSCASACNYDAIEMPFFTSEQIMAQVDAALAEKPEEKVVVFTCNWCSYPGADQAGIEKIQYPSNGRIIRTMCSARLKEEFITHAFDKGAGAVLVTGCRLQENGSDCHYNYANEHTLKRFNLWHRKLTRKGLEPERLQLQWYSAAQGRVLAEKMREMEEVIKRHLATVSA
jgi:heterodisulfide reductase subunit A